MKLPHFLQILAFFCLFSLTSFALEAKRSGTFFESPNQWQADKDQWITHTLDLLIRNKIQKNRNINNDAKDSHPFTQNQIQIFIQQARQNKTNSQLIFGLFHLFGIQRPQNTKQALYWIKKASKGLNPESYLFLNLLNKYHKVNTNQEYENYLRYIELIDEPSAVHGYVYLQLGTMNLLGEGTTQNEKLAIDYLIKADSKGSHRASYYLAMLYLDGSETTPMDKNKALQWLKKASKYQNPSACYHLAKFFEKGDLLPRDQSAALELYKIASKNNHAKAKYRLSQIYKEGRVVKYDSQKYLKYLQQSADLGELHAIYDLAKLYLFGEKILSKDATLAKKYLIKAAEKKHKESRKLLASLYLEIKLYSKAYEWFEQLALENDTDSLYICGKMLLDGIGVQNNHQKFLLFLKQASLQKHPKACTLYAKILYQEASDEEDISLYQDAFYWMMQAAKLNQVEAQYQLAVFYSKGIGTVINKQQAYYWYKKAASQNHVNSHIILASMLMAGEGHEANSQMAIHHYKQAALLNDRDAQVILYKLFSQGDLITQDLIEAYAWLNIINAYTHEFHGRLQELQNEMSAKSLTLAQNLSLQYLHTIQK
ncbi:MAG: sel1 repeat family protein [Candidatus Cloacimonetes bacterium]|nr:sel1 repeat family protein [Candidatus Cloacimonadota bacterium]